MAWARVRDTECCSRGEIEFPTGAKAPESDDVAGFSENSFSKTGRFYESGKGLTEERSGTCALNRAGAIHGDHQSDWSGRSGRTECRGRN